jgi:hypothetical protein
METVRPDHILIEGPADAGDFLSSLAAKKVKPPVALLAYTTELPVRTVLYPYASYSPEFQAICWGIQKKKNVRFIDLPSDVLLKLKPSGEEQTEEANDFHRFHNRLYERLADACREEDYETYWERSFEHNLLEDSFKERLACQSAQLRDMIIGQEYEAAPYDYSYNQIREAHMRMEIQRAINEGAKPEKTVVIVGAYHVAGILSDEPPMTAAELKSLPRVQTQITLMPYSYFRLSSRTGYGAGNKAPYYFELMWEAMEKNEPDKLPVTYVSMIASDMRRQGHNASPANAIEGVRLAQALTSLHSGSLPTLKDLHDAVTTCFGGGELSVVAEAINRADIGTAIGYLPEGVSQTPVQENMTQELRRLKLSDYKTPVARELSLDLRENIKVKSKEAAFIDLNRSTFLHRLRVLNIHFAEKVAVTQDSATWAEKWLLCWTPEVEIEIVEANLKGETLEIAAAYVLEEQLTECENIAVAAQIIRQAYECALTGIFDRALSALQHLLVDSTGFSDTAQAAREISTLVQYGDIRQFDSAPLTPVLQQLFLRSALLLVEASTCDDKAATAITAAIHLMETIAREHWETVDVSIWQKEVQILARRDDLNAKLSGVAFSILLEHNLADDERCAQEVSRRLSPGVPADLGAGWFEGLAGRNRYALLSRISLWRELDKYVQSLDDDAFFRAVVFLRRAFGDFDLNQKNSIAELLGDFWGTGAETTAEELRTELTETELEQLNDLNDFDF